MESPEGAVMPQGLKGPVLGTKRWLKVGSRCAQVGFSDILLSMQSSASENNSSL